MSEPAQDFTKTRILLVNLESYLSTDLAKSLIARNCLIYAIGKKAPTTLLNDRNFTLLDIDPNQPLPDYLPEFEMMFCFQKENYLNGVFLADGQNTQILNLVSYINKNNSKLFLIFNLKTDEHFLESLPNHKNLEVILIGDVYGPNDNYDSDPDTQNLLKSLIYQALKKDKIILKDQGRTQLYPTYISDAVFAVNKFAYQKGSKRVRIIVSQKPLNSLDAAYEIQSQLGLILNKQTDLFFLDGEQKEPDQLPQPVINFSDLSYLPKVKFEEGIKHIFEDIKKDQNDQEENIGNINQEEVPKNFEKPRKLPGIPSPKLPMLGGKKFAIFALFVFLALCLNLSLDLYLGLSSFKKASQSLNEGDFKQAQLHAQNSARKIEASASKISFVTNPLKPIAKNKILALNSLLEGSYLVSQSLVSFATGADSLSQNLKAVTSRESQDQSIDFENSTASFQRAYFQSLQSQKLIADAKEQKIFTSHLTNLENSISLINKTSIFASDLSNLIPQITGSKEKTYLVLIVDNRTLRPGGGLIRSFGTVDFENGKLKSMSFDEILALDNDLKQKIAPPAPLAEKLGLKQLFLKDSNFDLDFEKNAKVFQDIYQSETGRQTDGILALDLTFVQTFLRFTGPLNIKDHGQINADNLNEVDDGQILAKIALALLDELLKDVEKSTSSQNQNTTLINFINDLEQGFREKHIQVSANDQNIASFIRAKSISNNIPPVGFDPANDRGKTRDYIAISEADLTDLPARDKIQREIDYEVNVNTEASMQSALKLTYKNLSEENYLAYLTINTPFATSLSDYKIADTSRVREIVAKNQGSLSTFSTYIEIPKSQTQTYTFNYNSAKAIKIEQAPTYHLLVQKQPGTHKDTFNFSLNLPDIFKIDLFNNQKEHQGEKNLKIETDLSVDRNLEITLGKL